MIHIKILNINNFFKENALSVMTKKILNIKMS